MTPVSFWSLERSRLGNGLPCWLGTEIALPVLTVKPTERGTWMVGVGIGSERSGTYWARYRFCEVTAGTMIELLAQWEAGPEQALAEWWGEEVGEREGSSSEKSAEELGL